MPKPPDIRTRIRQRIKLLLHERNVTQRAFAKHLGHGDQWASNLLRGEFTLAMDQLDAAAEILGVQPGDIVRVASEALDLSVDEMRAVRALRLMPPVIRDHVIVLADYLVGQSPDEAELLYRIRSLTDEERSYLRHWVDAVRRGRPSAPDTGGKSRVRG